MKNAKTNNMVYGYVLKADVKHYFNTIDRKILVSIIKKKISDKKVIWLVEKILESEASRGIPIGSLMSQMCGNIYLNELDYFVKHKLKAKFYIRYMDDFVILHEDKEVLEEFKNQIRKFLSTRLKLELHAGKSKVYPLSKGVKFLGFRIFYKYNLLKKRNIQIINSRIESFTELYRKELITKDEIYASLEGWEAYSMHANTYSLRRKITKLID